jgi:fucose 4-O-acetylase-like acetyltransferase
MAEPGRNRYADLLRVCAMGGVVLGHWLLSAATFTRGQLSGVDALDYVRWGRWLTLLFQVMPVFFLVGGYANAVSWTARHARGEGWADWVRHRARRLLWPTAVYVTVAALAAATAKAAGVSGPELAQAGWVTALQLWFLPVYLLLIALTPAMLAAHRRWGLAVPAVMAVAAAGVDAAVLGPHLPLIGFANYLLVWGAMHQWGFAWQDGSLTRPWWRPWLLAAAGIAALAGLLTWGPFPVDMIGAGERVANTVPPSVALLAFAAAQTGLLLAAEPAARRLLARPRWWRPVTRLNTTTMTVYLWHMVPVIIVAVACYPTGVLPQPAVGSATWWALRPAWFALLAAVLVPLVAAVMWAERPLRRLPAGVGPARPWSPAVLGAGLLAAMAGLARLAIFGFAPAGNLPLLALALCASGLLLILLSGRPPPAGTPAAVIARSHARADD